MERWIIKYFVNDGLTSVEVKDAYIGTKEGLINYITKKYPIFSHIATRRFKYRVNLFALSGDTMLIKREMID